MSSKRKQPAKLVQPTLRQTAKLPVKSRVDETNTSISAPALAPTVSTTPGELIEISSDSESDLYDVSDLGEDESEDESVQRNDEQPFQALKSTESPSLDMTRRKEKRDAQDPDTEMLSPPQTKDDQDRDHEASDLEPTSPTFGDLVRGNETVDVSASLAAQQEPTPNSIVPSHPRTLTVPSPLSLGTVLNQALRTDDTDLLESCLHTTDEKVVRSTVQRMESSLAGVLLTNLAARMHRRPGRAHTLMTWVQCTLVAHGGALANHPTIFDRLGELSRVLEERSRGLNSLLALKGKLDMLEAQMLLRRTRRTRRSAPAADGIESDDGGDDGGIIYVEGEEDEGGLPNGTARTAVAGDGDDDFPIANGVSDSEGESEEEDDEGADLDELEVADEESLDEDEVDHDDDEDSAEEDDSDVDAAAPPAKVQKTNKAFPKRR